MILKQRWIQVLTTDVIGVSRFPDVHNKTRGMARGNEEELLLDARQALASYPIPIGRFEKNTPCDKLNNPRLESSNEILPRISLSD